MELRAYGVATTMYFPLVDKGATDFESTPVTIASGDCKISKDGGAFANTTTASFSHVAGGIYSIPLTATEMQAKVIVIKIVDQTGTKEWEDQAIVITTVNHASAEVPSLWAIPQSTATGAITSSSFAAGAINAAAIAADAITDAKVASDVTIASVTGAVGSVTGAVGSISAGGITASSIAADAIGASELAADAVTEIAAGVWGALVATYQTNSTFGKAFASATTPTIAAGVTLSAAAVQSIWDALTSALTTVGSVGKLIVDNLNATVSSRLASASYTAPLDAAGTRTAVGLASANLDTQLTAIDDYLDTEVAAIKAKTDNLPAAPAATGDCLTAAAVRTAVGLASANLDTQLTTIDDLLDTEVAAIKAKTDLIPAAPAAVGDIPTAIQNADALLNRDVSNTEAGAALHSLTSVILKLCSRFVGSTGRTYRTNGSTVHMTQTPTTDAAADPITELGVGA